MRDWSEWSSNQGASVKLQWSRLAHLLEEHMCSVPREMDPFIGQLLKGHGEEIAAILFYGSCLFSSTQRYTSFPDFYVLVSSLRRYHRSTWHATLNTVLPPNVYYGDSDNLRYKYCVMTLDQFDRETSHIARDIHHLGRFSKRFCLAYSRDEATTRAIVHGTGRAMLTLVPHSLALLPARFSLEEFVQTQLSLSYLGERRVVEPTKVKNILEASREFYLEIYALILQLYAHRFKTPTPEDGSIYSQIRTDRYQRQRTDLFLYRSQVRGILRWPKYILTVDNWLQYILDKLERHQGVRVELTGLQRRFPLIFGWPVYFELRRRGIVK